jgi:flavin-dependent dehydrogenase
MDGGVRTVAVIGGGPAGLAAAIALRRTGKSVWLFDSARPPIDKACGEGLMPDALHALRGLGLDGRPPSAAPIRGIRFVTSAGTFDADFLSGPGIAVRRVHLHSWLCEAADSLGVRCRWGVRAGFDGRGELVVDGQPQRPDLIVGADGQNSLVRKQAGLGAYWYRSVRYGFRRHYRVQPWSEHVEVYWSGSAQIYVAPVGPEEIGVAVLSDNPSFRVAGALENCAELRSRLQAGKPLTREMGALTVSQRLRRVTGSRVALVGDASGSVDSSTGNGIGLALQQAHALADAVRQHDLSLYERAHSRICRRSRLMSRLFLAAAHSGKIRDLVFRYLLRHPQQFEQVLGLHTGDISIGNLAENIAFSVLRRSDF